MPDKEHDNLERELAELGSRIDYPPTPDVAGTVRRRLDAEASQRSGPRSALGRLAKPRWAAAAAAIILLSLSALSPTMRFTVSESVFSGSPVGAGGSGAASSAAPSEYERGTGARDEASDGAADEAPVAAGASSGAGAAGQGMLPGVGLGFGERLSPSEARARVGELLLLEAPEVAAGPAAIYAGSPPRADGAVVV